MEDEEAAQEPLPNLVTPDLHDAVHQGREDRVTDILEGGVDPNSKDIDGIAALHIAARYDSLEVATVLIEKGASVEVADKFSRTPLHFAAAHGSVAMCRLLIEHGANVNCNTTRSVEEEKEIRLRYTLGWFVRKAAVFAAPCFFKKGNQDGYGVLRVPQNKRYTEYLPGQTPLHFAAIHDNLEVARFLVEKGTNTRITDEEGNFAATLAGTRVATAIRVAGMYQRYLAPR